MQGSLTQNLVQLHNSRVGTDAVHRLLLGGLALLEHLLILVARVVGRHGESIGARFRRSDSQLREKRMGDGATGDSARDVREERGAYDGGGGVVFDGGVLSPKAL